MFVIVSAPCCGCETRPDIGGRQPPMKEKSITKLEKTLHLLRRDRMIVQFSQFDWGKIAVLGVKSLGGPVEAEPARGRIARLTLG